MEGLFAGAKCLVGCGLVMRAGIRGVWFRVGLNADPRLFMGPRICYLLARAA